MATTHSNHCISPDCGRYRLPLLNHMFTRVLVYGDELGLSPEQLSQFRALLKPFRLYAFQKGREYRQKHDELRTLLSDPDLMRSPNYTLVLAKVEEIYNLAKEVDLFYYQKMHEGNLILTEEQNQILTTIYQQEEGMQA